MGGRIAGGSLFMLTITPLQARARRNRKRRGRPARAVTPVRLVLLSAVVAVAFGLGAVSASAATNALAWGINASGQLGDGATSDSSSPQAVSAGALPTGVSITELSGGYGHS